MKCCICKGEIEKKGTWNQGNNAEPVRKGRCCDSCDVMVVIPMRMRLMAINSQRREHVNQTKS